MCIISRRLAKFAHRDDASRDPLVVVMRVNTTTSDAKRHAALLLWYSVCFDVQHHVHWLSTSIAVVIVFLIYFLLFWGLTGRGLLFIHVTRQTVQTESPCKMKEALCQSE